MGWGCSRVYGTVHHTVISAVTADPRGFFSTWREAQFPIVPKRVPSPFTNKKFCARRSPLFVRVTDR